MYENGDSQNCRLTFVIHILEPLSTQPPDTAFAVVFILTTSEPAEFSDIANAPTFCPETNPGRNLSLCSSLPFRDN